MSQFISTEQANQAAKKAFVEYANSEERILAIKAMVEKNEPVSQEDIKWVCDRALVGIWQEKSSWFDHS